MRGLLRALGLDRGPGRRRDVSAGPGGSPHLRRRRSAQLARRGRRRTHPLDPGPGPARPARGGAMPVSRGGRFHFQPPDASQAPRYTGPRTFARLPHVEVPHEDVDAAVIGVPFDTATSFRTGTRFGPEAIRSSSALLRPYHPVLDIDVFATLSVVDGGDLEITPGNAQRTAEQIAEALEPVLRAGIVPVALGGDHSIVLGERRAHAAVHGAVGLILLDAHADTWDQYYGERYFHGTPFRRAVEEGLLDPSRSLLAGVRGALYDAADGTQPVAMGVEGIPGEELQGITPA